MKNLFFYWDLVDSYKLGNSLILASNHLISYEKVAFDTLRNKLIKDCIKNLYRIR